MVGRCSYAFRFWRSALRAAEGAQQPRKYRIETELNVAQGVFQIRRPGVAPKSPLRAWDAADEYLLDSVTGEPGPFLILNDSFGALGVALAPQGAASVSDSFVSLRSAERNLRANARSGVNLLPSHDWVERMGEVEPSMIVFKVPRTLSSLEHQLHQVRPFCSAGTTFIAGGMAKHIHNSTLALFERLIGPTTTSLARKKARLIHPVLDPALDVGESPWPRTVDLDDGHRIVAHPGVFAGDKLDIGTRRLLADLPPTGPTDRVLDLGCGNGIVGTAIAARSAASVTFTDDSYMAVESARATFNLAAPGATAEFVVDDAGTGLPDASFDLVVNNPPFHESNAITDATARRMFGEAKRLLRPGGELRVVGNRHLGYHVALKRIFGNCETAASDPKFVVLKALR